MPDQDLYEAGYEDGKADARDGDPRPARALPLDASYLAGYQAGVTTAGGPVCARHGAMVPETHPTPTQAALGAWWVCLDPMCKDSALIPNAALLVELERQATGR